MTITPEEGQDILAKMLYNSDVSGAAVPFWPDVPSTVKEKYLEQARQISIYMARMMINTPISSDGMTCSPAEVHQHLEDKKDSEGQNTLTCSVCKKSCESHYRFNDVIICPACVQNADYLTQTIHSIEKEPGEPDVSKVTLAVERSPSDIPVRDMDMDRAKWNWNGKAWVPIEKPPSAMPKAEDTVTDKGIGEQLDKLYLRKCLDCHNNPGAPELCWVCAHNRDVIETLKDMVRSRV